MERCKEKTGDWGSAGGWTGMEKGVELGIAMMRIGERTQLCHWDRHYRHPRQEDAGEEVVPLVRLHCSC